MGTTKSVPRLVLNFLDLYFGRGALGTDGTAGCVGATGAEEGDVSIIERGARCDPASKAKAMLVAKKAAAKIAVVRVSRLAVERPDMKPDIPPPPIPRAPPSLFWIRTTAMSATAIMR